MPSLPPLGQKLSKMSHWALLCCYLYRACDVYDVLPARRVHKQSRHLHKRLDIQSPSTNSPQQTPAVTQGFQIFEMITWHFWINDSDVKASVATILRKEKKRTTLHEVWAEILLHSPRRQERCGKPDGTWYMTIRVCCCLDTRSHQAFSRGLCWHRSHKSECSQQTKKHLI